jgi:hypothetical protein
MKTKYGNTAYFAKLAWCLFALFAPFPSVCSPSCHAARVVSAQVSRRSEGNFDNCNCYVCIYEGVYSSSSVAIAILLSNL